MINKKLFLLFSLVIINTFFFITQINSNGIYNKLLSLRPINSYCILIIFGTRPDILKLIPIINELKNNKKFFCITINTGQHKKMSKQILESLNMSKNVDIELNVMEKNQSLVKLTSKIILELDKIYTLFNPDSIIVQGDTTTSFSAALSAFYKKIPIFHVESGLRTKNIYSPFPEEFNRMSIDDISTLLFAPTNISASNLLNENKDSQKIFITGNTIVDTLKLTLNGTYPSKYINDLIENAKSFYKNHDQCKIILLTCHRRENYFYPIINIIKAVQKLLKEFEDIIIVFPTHLNPNVIQSIKMGLPESIYDDLINRKKIKEPAYAYFNRLFLIQPLNYIDLIHLLSVSFFIMTDSGGIQEESISMSKPVLILRNNTERIEGVKAGCAILAGTSIDHIYNYASLLIKNITLYNSMSKLDNNIYGSGNSSKIIVNIIERYFENRLFMENYSNIENDNNLYILNYSKTLLNYDELLSKSNNNEVQYDIVIVLTVWRRNNLERQLIQIKRQSIIQFNNNKKINIIIFQNSNHTDINAIIKKWKFSNNFNDNVKISHIHSPIETGYFGRFLSPLTSSVTSNAFFIICDDDMIWGDRYFENMIRVVEEGSLATRNGRLITKTLFEISPVSKFVWHRDVQACFNEDIEYDFGGHIWAGRISWLRKAWNHIPVSIENCEDFWISSVLKTYYNISTRTPKCPCPEGKLINPEFCAASDKTAKHHIDSKIGDAQNKRRSRRKIMISIMHQFNYTPLLFKDANLIMKIRQKFKYGNDKNPLFNLSDHLWDKVYYWQ